MRIFKLSRFKEAAQQYPQHASGIYRAGELLEQSTAASFYELKALFSSLDKVKGTQHQYVIDIAGNNIRLVGDILFNVPHSDRKYASRLYVHHIISHAEYDKL